MSVRGVTSVLWDEAMRWSRVRREAALIVAGEANGGHWNHEAWTWWRPETPGA